jgi:hypothetical protein
MIYKMKKYKNNIKSRIKPKRVRPRKAKNFFFLYKRRKTNKISLIEPFCSSNKKIKNIKRKKITKICKPTNILFTFKFDKKKLKYHFLKIKKRKKKKI